MVRLNKTFFFRTTWFPELSHGSVKPLFYKHYLLSSSFPTSLHFAHVSGRGTFRHKGEGPLILGKPLRVKALQPRKFKPGELIVNPFLFISENKATFWVQDGNWKKFSLELTPLFIERLKTPEEFSRRDQKLLLAEGILWRLQYSDRSQIVTKKFSPAALAREKNFSFLAELNEKSENLMIVHPPVVRNIAPSTWDELRRASTAVENIFGPLSKDGDHRQTGKKFKEAFAAKFGGRTVQLSEVFDPLEGLTFPYLKRVGLDLSPSMQNLFDSLLRRGDSKVQLTERDLEKLERASAGKAESDPKILCGYIRLSSHFEAGRWNHQLHEIVNSPVFRPFYPMASFDRNFRKEFVRDWKKKNHYQLLNDLPLEFRDVGPGSRVLQQAVLLDHRDFRKGDLWWKDLWCSLSNGQFILKKKMGGPEVRILLPTQINREMIEIDAYRFLASVSDQGAPSSLSWTWPHENIRSFPRVTFGAIILSPRKWLVEPGDIALRAKRKELGLPESFFLLHASEKFLIRDHEEEYLRRVLERVKSPEYKVSKFLVIEEAFSDSKRGAQSAEGGEFREEIFIRFKRQSR